jgi:purine-nucleoside phosphorylase
MHLADLPAAIATSVARIHDSAPGLAPRLGMVLGSGWDGIADLVQGPVDIPYAELPAFPVLGVAGQVGAGRLASKAAVPADRLLLEC